MWGRFLVTAAIAGVASRALATPGMLDPSFGAGGRVSIAPPPCAGPCVISPVLRVDAVHLQADGNILVGAETGNGLTVVRLLPDGALDTAFGTGGFASAGVRDRATALAVQPDGRILAGSSSTVVPDASLVRFNADGTLDTSFGGTGIVTIAHSFSYLNALVVQPDGMIVAAAGDGFRLARYRPDGTLDPGFGTGGLVASPFGAHTIFDDVTGLALQPDGKIVAAGTGPNVSFAVLRYQPDGTLDPSFGVGGIVGLSPAGPADSVVLQPDGEIVAGGRYGPLYRLDAAGNVDTIFAGAGGSLALEPGGKVVSVFGAGAVDAARYRVDGTLDPSFGVGAVVSTDVTAHDDFGVAGALQPDGAIVAASWTLASFGMPHAIGVVRWLGGTCGNGVVEAGEDCDDGNLQDGDGCDAHCCVADADGDGECDAIDVCTGGVAIGRPKVAAGKLLTAEEDDTLTVTGRLAFAAAPGPSVSPPTNGIRVTLRNAAGALLDLTIPPGVAATPASPGWSTRVSSVKRFAWRGTPGLTPFGIYKAVLLDRSLLVPGDVCFTIKGKGGAIAAFATDFPLTLTVGLEGATSPGGLCGTATFAASPAVPGCSVLRGGANLLCK